MWWKRQTIREGLFSIEDQKYEILREDQAEEYLRGYWNSILKSWIIGPEQITVPFRIVTVIKDVHPKFIRYSPWSEVNFHIFHKCVVFGLDRLRTDLIGPTRTFENTFFNRTNYGPNRIFRGRKCIIVWIFYGRFRFSTFFEKRFIRNQLLSFETCW